MKKKKNNMMIKAGKIYYTLCHAKDKFEEINNKKMALNCDRARIALCDIMKGMKTETVKPSNKIIISTNIIPNNTPDASIPTSIIEAFLSGIKL